MKTTKPNRFPEMSGPEQAAETSLRDENNGDELINIGDQASEKIDFAPAAGEDNGEAQMQEQRLEEEDAEDPHLLPADDQGTEKVLSEENSEPEYLSAEELEAIPRVNRHTYKDVLESEMQEDELIKIADEISRRLSEKDARENEKRLVTKRLNNEITELEEGIHSLNESYRTGTNQKEVECEKIFDFDAKRVTVIRLDTYEIIQDREMEPGENQIMAFDEAGDDEKGEDGPELENDEENSANDTSCIEEDQDPDGSIYGESAFDEELPQEAKEETI